MTRLRFWSVFAVTAAATLVAATASAVPSLNVTSSYNPAANVIVWEINVDQDGTGFLAIEAPFTLAPDTPTFDVGLRANSSASQDSHGLGDNNGAVNETWYYNVDTNGTTLLWNTQEDAANLAQNVGTNPFTTPPNEPTEGLWMDTANRRLFAALGSDTNMPQPVKTLHIASNDGIFNWANLFIAEGGSNVTLTGFRSSIRKFDMNGIGVGTGANFNDLSGFGQVISGNLPAYEAANPGLDGIARADLNDDGAANFLDLAHIAPCLLLGRCGPTPEIGGAGAEGEVGASGVPEPATILLAGLVVGTVLSCARRSRSS